MHVWRYKSILKNRTKIISLKYLQGLRVIWCGFGCSVHPSFEDKRKTVERNPKMVPEIVLQFLKKKLFLNESLFSYLLNNYDYTYPAILRTDCQANN